MWYKNLLRTDNGLEPQIVRVTEEIDKDIKNIDVTLRIRHMACLCFAWGGLWHTSILYYRMHYANIMR